VVSAVQGTPQSATVGTAFGTPLQVRVTDAFNNPVSGVTVTFAAPAGGATATFGGATTVQVQSVNGVATAPAFTAGGTAGSYPVTAAVVGVGTPAVFSLTNVAIPVTPPGSPTSPSASSTPSARGISAQLVFVKFGRKRRLMIDVLFADTGAKKGEFLSPFQAPAFKNVQVSVLDNDRIVVTARKGKRTVTAVFSG
jgi:hypothetical protein